MREKMGESVEQTEMLERLNSLSRRVDELEKEVWKLKNAQNVEAQPVSSNVPVTPETKKAVFSTVQSPDTVQGQQYSADRTPENKKNKNMEQTVGKYLMGILASVLILFSLILFGGLIYRAIPDAVKVGIMFTVSAVIAGVGIMKMKKGSKYDVLFAALAGCGVSAIYISALITCFTYEVISRMTLLVILVLWLVATGFLAREKSRMFAYICNVGLIISSMLALAQWQETYLGILVYAVGVVLLFLISDRTYKTNIYLFLQVPVIQFLFGFFYLDQALVICVLMIISFAALAYCIAHYTSEKMGKGMTITLISLTMACIFLQWSIFKICELFGSSDSVIGKYSSYVWIVQAIVLYVLCRKKYGEYLSFGILSFSLLFVNAGIVNDYVGYLLVVPFLFAAAVYLKERKFWYLFYAYVLITMVNTTTPVLVNHWFSYGGCFLFMILSGICLLKKYSREHKYMNTALWIVLFISICVEESASGGTLFILLVLIDLLLNSKWYRKNPITHEEEKISYVIGYLMNLIMMVWGSSIISICNAIHVFGFSVSSEAAAVVFYSVITLILYMLNISNLFRFRKEMSELPVGIYICSKFLALLYVILYRMDAVGYAVSIVTLVFAVASIVIGFMTRHKSFRLYGLILTFISVVKLVLFDVSYDSNILKPIGFFVAGVLCFIINWVYSRFEKQIEKSDK